MKTLQEIDALCAQTKPSDDEVSDEFGGNSDNAFYAGWSRGAWEVARDIRLAIGLTSPRIVLGLRPYMDGNMWCFLYGENIQEGTCGFGETVELAAQDFDKNWQDEKAAKSPPTTTK